MNHRPSDKKILHAQSLAGRALNVPLPIRVAVVALAAVLYANPAAAASTTGSYSAQPVFLFGIPVDFILFGLTLLGVAIFHNKTLQVALTGLAVVAAYMGFKESRGNRQFRKRGQAPVCRMIQKRTVSNLLSKSRSAQRSRRASSRNARAGLSR